MSDFTRSVMILVLLFVVGFSTGRFMILYYESKNETPITHVTAAQEAPLEYLIVPDEGEGRLITVKANHSKNWPDRTLIIYKVDVNEIGMGLYIKDIDIPVLIEALQQYENKKL